MTVAVEQTALICGVGLLLVLAGLAAVVQWRRPPEKGISGFVIFVGIVVVFAILALFDRAGA